MDGTVEVNTIVYFIGCFATGWMIGDILVGLYRISR